MPTELISPEWLRFGFAGLTSLLFLALLVFLVLAMKTLNQISGECHTTSLRMIETMTTALDASTEAIKENSKLQGGTTQQLGAAARVIGELQKFLIKHNGG
jgi:hypothetical protein